MFDAMISPPYYSNAIRYPLEMGMLLNDSIYPASDATTWLIDQHANGIVGPWETTLQRDQDGYYLLVSFFNDEDATLFKLKWC